MKHLFSKFVLGVGIVAAIILSLSTYTFAIIGDCGKPLADIETILQRIETNKLIQSNDEAVDKLFDVFVETVKRERNAAGNDKNKLTEFRNALKLYHDRLKIIENRIKIIEGKIKTGEIKLSKPILQTMNQTEIGEFRKFLVPDALNQYEKLHPEIFKLKEPPQKTTPRPRSMNQDIPNDGTISVVQDFLNLLPGLVTPAYASSEECNACYQINADCKRGCCRCRWYKPWCCVCKAACAVGLALCVELHC